jgi:hypothetical protein
MNASCFLVLVAALPIAACGSSGHPETCTGVGEACDDGCGGAVAIDEGTTDGGFSCGAASCDPLRQYCLVMYTGGGPSDGGSGASAFCVGFPTSNCEPDPTCSCLVAVNSPICMCTSSPAGNSATHFTVTCAAP